MATWRLNKSMVASTVKDELADKVATSKMKTVNSIYSKGRVSKLQSHRNSNQMLQANAFHHIIVILKGVIER